MAFPINPASTEIDPVDHLKEENELWKNQNIHNYRMIVNRNSVWAEYNIHITVMDNEVENFKIECGTAIMDSDGIYCKEIFTINISQEEYTIPAMFNTLIASSWDKSFSITFNHEYHYPEIIDYDDPDRIDEEYTIKVTEFNIIEK
jgi:hypothetical protein